MSVATSRTFMDDKRRAKGRSGALRVDLNTSGVARVSAFGWLSCCVLERLPESFSAVDRRPLAYQL